MSNNKKEKITKRAFHYFLERGAEPGKALEDWLRAEQEVSKEAERSKNMPKPEK